MGRPVVLSNGRMFLGLNENGLVHDFYYPYVGLENLTNARSLEHKIGVWVDGQFSWTDDGTWQLSIDFESEALVSNISMYSEKLQTTLHFNDFVDYEHTAFIRRIEVTNHASEKRDMRVFMHQVFQLSQDGRADTALYVPDQHYILNYKGRRCLLIGGKVDEEADFDQFAVGNYAVEGKSGTYMDAEDGDLSGNLVEHGGVDSVIRFQKSLAAKDTYRIDYWIIADTTQSGAADVHAKLRSESIEQRLESVRESFREWLKPAVPRLASIEEPYKTSILKSLLVIKAHCDVRGSVLASGDSSIFNYGRDYYCYCWPRDAAYVLWPLIRLGIYEEARRFFKFARDVQHKDGYLMHKYQPDRAIGSTWHPMLHNGTPELPIQEDETAGVLFMMSEYYEASRDIDFVHEYYDSFIRPAADFMASFVDEATSLPHASYDLWEEKFLTSTYSVSITIGALNAAISLANTIGRPDDAQEWRLQAAKFRGALGALYHPDGYFRKGYLLQKNGDLAYDDTLDISSLYGPFMYVRLSNDDEKLLNTARNVEERLLNSSPSGGVIRYENDNYFRTKPQYSGNPWIVCTMWLAQYYAYQGEAKKAKDLIDWTIARQTPSGILSEQFDPETGESVGVTPLVWSHAELANTILDMYQI